MKKIQINKKNQTRLPPENKNYPTERPTPRKQKNGDIRNDFIEMGSEKLGNPNHVCGKDFGTTCPSSYHSSEHQRTQQKEEG